MIQPFKILRAPIAILMVAASAVFLVGLNYAQGSELPGDAHLKGELRDGGIEGDFNAIAAVYVGRKTGSRPGRVHHEAVEVIRVCANGKNGICPTGSSLHDFNLR